MPGIHAILPPSGASRWINCPASVALTRDLPDSGSTYAAEGTLAHSLAELSARKRFIGLGPQKFAAARRKIKADPLYRPEMDGHVQTYVDFIDALFLSYEHTPHVALEVRVDMAPQIPECFGTIDCVLIGDGRLDIVDFKYGQGVPVSAEANPQLLLYALGAVNAYGMLYEIDRIAVHIVQPRLDSTSDYEMTADDLMEWAKSIQPSANAAIAGGGNPTPGAWCRFCKLRSRCRARNMTPADVAPLLSPVITNAEIADRIRQLRPLVDVLKGLEELALSECLNGEDVPGFKAVEGRALRAWTDSDAAFAAAIAAGTPEEMLYERKPLTLAAVEKLLGKKQFSAALGSYAHTPPGKPTLVESNDERPAITNRVDAKTEFENASSDI